MKDYGRKGRNTAGRKIGIAVCLCSLACILFCGCSRAQGDQELVNLNMVEGDGYVAIIWEERTYVPFCVVSKKDCGKQIGYVDGDTNDRVCEYKDYPPEEWIASYLTVDGGAMLYKEINVTDIPDGLQSEYEWNDTGH